MFKDEYHPQVKKDLRKLDPAVLTDIKTTHLAKILESPLAFDLLSGDLEGLYSYHFRKNKNDYRICYLVNTESETVFFLMIGKRENFYALLRRRL
jgi:addiction module RelE/StbE family toxin